MYKIDKYSPFYFDFGAKEFTITQSNYPKLGDISFNEWPSKKDTHVTDTTVCIWHIKRKEVAND